MDGGSGGGFPVIESAAADTTCNRSGPYQATPLSPSPSPSSSDDHQHSQIPLDRRRQMTSDLGDPHLPTKRRRVTSDLDESASFTFPHHVKEAGPSSSGMSSIIHPSGRMLPVGIAQPIQSREEPRDMQPQALEKSRPLWKDEGGGEVGETGPLEAKLGHHRAREGVETDDETAVQEVISQINTGISSSDSSSSSSDDDNDEEDGRMEPGQLQNQNLRYQNETTNVTEPETGLNQTQLPQEQTGLPGDKKHHLFLSHSTGDQAAVKNDIVVPLRERQGLKVVACYHCMVQGNQYNDRHIERAMSESCVVLVGISPSYLDSQRCQKEWKRACDLAAEGGGRTVVVAALGRCSRPDELKQFLYLDFIDRDKGDHVLQKLTETINSAVAEMSVGPALLSPGDQGLPEHDPAANERVPLALGGCEIGGDEHQRRLEEEFEADFGGESLDGQFHEEMGQSDPRITNLSGGERKREKGSEEVEEGEVSDSSASEDKTAEETATSTDLRQSEKVANFYNELAKPDADKRDESPIFYMRNFNNWVKSVLIRTHIQPEITVLDLCCGKGGDLLKWKEGGIGYIVCADISESSVEACRGRYGSQRMCLRGSRQPPFGAEFHVADCCSVRLRDLYHTSGLSFNIVSCQFSVHYSFESYHRAHMMLRNACENLRPGGVFIGTTVDSNEIVRRLREGDQRREDGSWFIGNQVFSVTLDSSLDPRKPLPLFGAKYNFKLHGVVDLPEYLVHFPLFEQMLKDFDMELVLCQNFTNFFDENRNKSHNINLMYKMQAFDRQTATMPRELWEVIGLYLVYVFRKRIHSTHF